MAEDWQASIVLTLGIDLASTNGSTGICEVDWSDRTSSVEVGRFADEEIAARIRAVNRAGGWAAIDAPFGFPVAFARAVHRWHSSGTVPAATDHDIRRRITDCYVAERQAIVKAERLPGGWNTWPLSSVVDLITPSVIRCARILMSANAGAPLDRIGLTSRIVEAYPIAALRSWGVATYKYKSNGADCDTMLRDLCEQTGLRQPVIGGPLARGCEDDVVDALVCALLACTVAGAGGTTGPQAAGEGYAAQLAIIEEEGWIHLPPPGHRLDSLARITISEVIPEVG